MAFRRLSVRKIHLFLRLFFAAGMSIRAISRSIHASPSTVGDYIRRARVAGLSWPLPEGMDERALEARLFPPPQPSETPRPLPEWAYVHRERRRKRVTLAWTSPGSVDSLGLRLPEYLSFKVFPTR